MSQSEEQPIVESDQERTNKAQRLKKIMIIVAAIVIVVLIIIGLSFLIASLVQSNPPCQPSKTIPSYADVYDPKRVASKDFKTLAAVAAYLEVQDIDNNHVEQSFMPMDGAVSVSFKDHDGQNGTLTLSNDCIKIEIYLRTQSDSYIYSTNIKVDLNPISGINLICQTNYGVSLYPEGKHYVCHQPVSYDCIDYEGRNVNLVFQSFEFELDGRPEYIKRGLFSKQSYNCG